MIALFNTYEEAQSFSDKVHNFLLANRKDYTAEKWADPDKSEAEEKYFVKVPDDFEKWNVKLDIEHEEKVLKLPITWRKIETEPIIKDIIIKE